MTSPITVLLNSLIHHILDKLICVHFQEEDLKGQWESRGEELASDRNATGGRNSSSLNDPKGTEGTE